MLGTLFVFLLVLNLSGLVSGYAMGGFIHILLVVAIVMVLIRIIQGRVTEGLAKETSAVDGKVLKQKFRTRERVIDRRSRLRLGRNEVKGATGKGLAVAEALLITDPSRTKRSNLKGGCGSSPGTKDKEEGK